MPSTSSFFTSLLTYMNRIIVVRKDFFLNEVLAVLHQQ